jgi:hypothetical protein
MASLGPAGNQNLSIMPDKTGGYVEMGFVVHGTEVACMRIGGVGIPSK